MQQTINEDNERKKSPSDNHKGFDGSFFPQFEAKSGHLPT